MNPSNQTWRQRRKESFQMEQTRIKQMNEEISNNIINDSLLSQSYGNPDWYPSVPKYRVPKWKKYTSTEITEIKKSRDASFINDNIVVGRIPLSSRDMDDQFVWLFTIDPYLLSRTISHEQNIDVITWHIQSSKFSYPEITSCVWYIVNIYVDRKANKQYLSHIYVYNDQKAIDSLIDFLSDLKVKNMDDLKNSGEYFMNMLLNK